MGSLTRRRLDAIRDALSYRLASRCPGDDRPVQDYREALAWATEQAMKRDPDRFAPRPIQNHPSGGDTGSPTGGLTT
jgi:hypothetical protein